MAFESGWGHDGLAYNGKEMRELVETLTGSLSGVTGGTNALKVSQQTVAAATVKVAEGGAVIPATGAGLGGSYQVYNDADLTSPTIAPTSANGRKDRLIIRVTNGVPALEVVQGTASGSPAEPSITGDNYLELALITLPASTTNITDAMITDRRVRLAGGTPVVTSATRPASPHEGMRIYETDTDRLMAYDGASWVRGPWFSAAGQSQLRVRRAAAQSIANNTVSAIIFDTEDADPDGWGAAPTLTWTVPAGLGGIYSITAFGGYASTIGTRGYAEIVGGSRRVRSVMTTDSTFGVSGTLPLAAGEVLKIEVYQNSGAAVNLNSAEMIAYRLGA